MLRYLGIKRFENVVKLHLLMCWSWSNVWRMQQSMIGCWSMLTIEMVDENVDQTQGNYELTSCRSEFTTHFLVNARVDIWNQSRNLSSKSYTNTWSRPSGLSLPPTKMWAWPASYLSFQDSHFPPPFPKHANTDGRISSALHIFDIQKFIFSSERKKMCKKRIEMRLWTEMEYLGVMWMINVCKHAKELAIHVFDGCGEWLREVMSYGRTITERDWVEGVTYQTLLGKQLRRREGFESTS